MADGFSCLSLVFAEIFSFLADLPLRNKMRLFDLIFIDFWRPNRSAISQRGQHHFWPVIRNVSLPENFQINVALIRLRWLTWNQTAWRYVRIVRFKWIYSLLVWNTLHEFHLFWCSLKNFVNLLMQSWREFYLFISLSAFSHQIDSSSNKTNLGLLWNQSLRKSTFHQLDNVQLIWNHLKLEWNFGIQNASSRTLRFTGTRPHL